MKQGKVWGTTELICTNPIFEYHRIEIKAGGYCSKHRHVSKWNGFYLESGRLLIHVWQGERIDTTDLKPGQYTEVPAGLFHQFDALDDSVAFELYWSQYRPDDIEREDVGGLKRPFIES